jgi:hypothetical protein
MYSKPVCLLPRIGPAGFMGVKMNIALRKRTLSPVLDLLWMIHQFAAPCYMPVVFEIVEYNPI